MFDKKKFLISSISITLLLFCLFHNVENVIHRTRFLQEESEESHETENKENS